MNIRKVGNRVIVSKVLKRNETYRITEGSKFKTFTILKKPKICVGYSSKTEDNQHILLLDYDGCDKSVVLEDINYLQEEWGLPPAYLFITKKDNYHVVFLSKHPPKEAMELMEHTHIDLNFISSPTKSKFRSWVLRLSKKKGSKIPKFIEIVDINKKPISDFPISSAHKVLLSKIFPKIKHPNYGSLEDNLKKVKMQEYETSN